MAHREQSILITGCSSGIGRAIAEEMVRRGHRVAATARKVESLDSLNVAQRLSLDVTSDESIGTCVEQVLAEAGHIDMLVNNAGVHLVGPVVELPATELRRLFDTNVVGLVAVSQAVFPHMAERGQGRFVHIGSIAHLFATPFSGAYAASKAAVHQLSLAMRMEVAPLGLDVIEVQPGAVRSKLADNVAESLEPYRSERSRYRNVYEGIKRRAYASQQRPMEAETFAFQLADAILAEHPPRLVRIGAGVSTLPWLSRLPPALVERAMSSRFGLDALKR